MSVARYTIGMVYFDGMTLLDSVGPADLFARVPGVRLMNIGVKPGPVTTDCGIRVIPDCVLGAAPELNVLFVGGGGGTTELLADADLLSFLSRRAPQADWIMSVCTGALVLGAANLLRGYTATTHWSMLHALPLFGATTSTDRVVIDRNRATGGGVTAGIDLALSLIARQWGTEQAELVQLVTEYNPHPPFDAGSPQRAPGAVRESADALFAPLTTRRTRAAEVAAERLMARARD
ncbi:DJ-1/PfpI family protein [Nocardia sp. NPDC005978]|uniref:DJ-1/PfpI family protein n=1 Tax=Nocardia sp. NPDC005978 TaxID=3156725 RepID=UPI0033BB389B